MVFAFFSTLLSATQIFTAYGFGGLTPSNINMFTNFEYYESQEDFVNVSTSSNGNYYNYGDKEYLIQHREYVIKDDYGAYGYGFVCNIADEVRATYEIPEADENMFRIGISIEDEDFSGHSVITYFNQNNTFFTNTEFNFHFSFYNYDDRNATVTYDSTANFDLTIPMWNNEGYGIEINNQLPLSAENMLAEVGQDDTVYLVVDITFNAVDMAIVQQYWYNQGYQIGYDNGIALGGNTSFHGLLGAIIDTPILFLRKMFGYEVLGVNLYFALATVMSLVVALAIFRIIRGII